MILNYTFAAGEKKVYDGAFRYLLILADGGGTVDLLLRSTNGYPEFSDGMNAGFSVEAVAGEFEKIEITSSTAQNVRIYIGSNKAAYLRLAGLVQVTSSISNPVIVDNKGSSYGANYKSFTAIGAGATDLVFSAASNVNGAIVYLANFYSINATSVNNSGYLAKATTPASNIDGDLLVQLDNASSVGSNIISVGKLSNTIRIPAGKALFYFSQVSETIGFRSVTYTLL